MKSKILPGLLLLFVAAAIYGVFFRNNKKVTDDDNPPLTGNFPAVINLAITYKKEYPHNVTAYTEGLEFYNGRLYESGGNYKTSFIAMYDSVNYSVPVTKTPFLSDSTIFAEGITILNDTIYQLTYKNNIVILYNAKTLKQIGRLPWIDVTLEGWGLTNNGKQLIASTGNNILYFLNAKDLKIERAINVKMNGEPADRLNELEYVDGYIYANQFGTDDILKIDEGTGHVLGKLNVKGILPGYEAETVSKQPTENNANEKYLNGIAYHKSSGAFFITGKNWPKLFAIKF